MADLLTIWNAALGHVGESEATISDKNEQSAQARACRRFWPIARDAALAEAAWPFARRVAPVAGYAPAPHPWSHAYLYPTDAVGIVSIVDPAGLDIATPFEIGGVTTPHGYDTTLILTAQELAWIVYTRRVEDVTRYPPLFVDAVAWRLAWEIAVPLSISREIRNDCFQVYQIALQRALLAAAKERRIAPGTPPLLRARRTASV